MALSDTVKVKKLMDLVKLGELPSWILMQDFTPKCIAGAVQRGNCQHYSKDAGVKEAEEGGGSGISMVLAAYVIFSYCHFFLRFRLFV